MTIQFNKVTWYSKLAAVIVLILIIFLAWYIGEQYKEVDLLKQSVDTSAFSIFGDGKVALNVGQSADINGLNISFDSIVQDSRCPVDVQCIQAGSVTAHITVRSDGKTEEKNLLLGAAPYIFGNYSISIIRVAPNRHSKTDISAEKYMTVFQVTKLLSA